MITVNDVSLSYGTDTLFTRTNLLFTPGNCYGIIGANGAGKSTIMWTLSGVLKPSSGEILFDGSPLPGKPHEIVRSGLALVPERRRLFADLTVHENLVMGAYLRHDSAIEADLEKNFALFPILKQRLKQYAGTLSGGEQQMLAIARAMMSAPRMILFDEPSLGLAPIVVDTLMETIRELRERGMTVLLVEQNAGRALEISDRAYVLEVGQITREGPGKNLLDDPEVRRAYLGELA